MERRLLIAFALSFLIIMLSRALWEPSKPPVPPAQPPSTTRQAPQEEKAPAAQAAKPEPVPLEQKRDTTAKTYELETDLFKLTLSNQGAAVKSWVLKRYKDSSGKPLDLLEAKRAQQFGAPFLLRVDREEEATKILASALFSCDSSAKIITNTPGGPAESLSFEYSDGKVRAIKKLTVTPGSYKVQVESKVWVNGRPNDHYLIWPAGFGDPAVEERTALHQALYRSGQKITRLKADKIEAEREVGGGFDFAGLEDQYFAALFLPGTEPVRRVLLSRDEETVESGKKQMLPSVGVLVAAQDSGTVGVFVGPKDTEVLTKAGGNLIDVIDYGWFGIVARPLFLGLKAIYAYVRNYGVAIVLLTIVINLALFPLRYKSMVSAHKMQKVQPQIKAVQEKYKKLKPTDPKRQQMNTEVMALYKEHGVNPLGGCLPMLLQMPFFLAFYNLLSVAIELRQAPFMLWIQDLSVYDRTFILPVLMTVSMIVSQKMTPTPSADPVQAKMMLAMPLVFGFMLAFTSSGLVLYWLTSNLVGIGQQYFMNTYGPAAAADAVRKQKRRKSGN